jgi:hypothetical protein
MKLLRRLHLYLGCFFAPMLLFYVLSGWYQVVNRDRLKSVSEAQSLPQKMRVVHTDLIYPTSDEVDKPSSPRLYRGLVICMAVALLITILIGVVLAFKTIRPQWPVWVSLALGLLAPALMLWLGQGR